MLMKSLLSESRIIERSQFTIKLTEIAEIAIDYGSTISTLNLQWR